MTANRAPAGRAEACAIEALALAGFMIAAAVVTAAVEHPASPLHAMLPDAVVRRAAIGVAMGVTAAAIVYSRWGQRSGAHLNPVVTLTFWRLGRITGADAAYYAAAQFAGAAFGLTAARVLLGDMLAHPSVRYIATVPGAAGSGAAFAAEAGISFGLMLVVLSISGTRLSRWTGLAAAVWIAMAITFEAPLSGMSMNPARSLAPAVAAGTLRSMWIYAAGPGAGMFLAARVHRVLGGTVRCAALHHSTATSCRFGCHRSHRPEPITSYAA